MSKVSKISALLLLIMTLNACVPFLAGTVVGGVSVYDRRSMQTMRDDNNIRHQIGMKLRKDKRIKESNIVISSFNYHVVLAGQTPYASFREKVEKLARDHKKVKKVYNEIEIRSQETYLSEFNDSWITTKVKSALITTPDLKSGMLKVLTVDNVVYLMGDISTKQQELAVDTARRVNGVKRVVTVFDVNSPS